MLPLPQRYRVYPRPPRETCCTRPWQHNKSSWLLGCFLLASPPQRAQTSWQAMSISETATGEQALSTVASLVNLSACSSSEGLRTSSAESQSAPAVALSTTLFDHLQMRYNRSIRSFELAQSYSSRCGVCLLLFLAPPQIMADCTILTAHVLLLQISRQRACRALQDSGRRTVRAGAIFGRAGPRRSR